MINPAARLVTVGILCVAIGVGSTWAFLRPPSASPSPVALPASQKPPPSPTQHLLDALTQAVRAGQPDQVSRYIIALSALGPEALPEIRKRLKDPNLSPEVFAAYATALLETGGQDAFSEAEALWKSPQGAKAGMALKRPLAIAISKLRSSQAGQALLDLWLTETDPEAQKLLAEALKTNPAVTAPLADAVWKQSIDPALSQRLQELVFAMSSQSSQQDEARGLAALDVGAPQTLETLRVVLSRPGTANKSLALALLEKRGDGQALEILFDYAREGQGSLRHQALSGFCRKAGTGQTELLASWYSAALPAVRADILNAVGQGENLAFLPFVTEQVAKSQDESLRKKASRAKDLLIMTANRRKIGLTP